MVTHSKMSLGAESVRERRITRIVQHSTLVAILVGAFMTSGDTDVGHGISAGRQVRTPDIGPCRGVFPSVSLRFAL
jgi:hypothetical protein